MTFKSFRWSPAWFEQADALKHITPAWETELQKLIVTKTEFVALTMGCKVDIVTKDPTVTKLTEAGKSIVMVTFNERFEIIENHFRHAPRPYGCESLPMYCLLKDATQLAYNLGWQLPKPMLKLISPPLKQNKARSTKGQVSHSPSLTAFGFKSDYLDEVCVLIKRYFTDERGNPITDPRKWPLKKTMESTILHGRLLEAVDTLITSGQRRGNRKN